MSTLLKVKSIGTFKNKFTKCAALSLYFPGKNNTRLLVYVVLKYKIYLVKGLQANLLINNDILF